MAWVLGICVAAASMTANAADTLKIGVIGPMTGAGAPWGAVLREAPKMVASDINAKGGLDVGGKKYKIEIISYDDQYKASEAIAAYNRLTSQDGVKYIMMLSSISVLAVKPMAEEDKVVILASGGAAKMIDRDTKYVFRSISAPAEYIPAFVGWVAANLKERRVAIINPNDESGWDLANLGSKAYKENGFEIVATEVVERTVKDYQPVLTRIISKKANVIDLCGIAPASTGVVIRQARELGYTGQIVKSSAPAPKELVAGAGKEMAEGTITLLYVDPANAGYKRLVETYRNAIGQDPDDLIALYYDAANVLLRAIQVAGDVNDSARVAASFGKALPMTSVLGDTLTLGGKAMSGVDHTIETANYVGVIRNGLPVVIGKAE